jgi:hypothetical protein
MSRRTILCAVVVGAFALGACLRAQEPTSELRIKLSAPDGSAVSGALVALLNAKDSVVAEGLTGETGTRSLIAPRGAYRVRVRRIGYLPFVSSELTLPRAAELALNVESARVVLRSIVVNSKSRCGRSEPGTQALSTVWDEIDKALRSSQLTLRDLAGIGRARTYTRDIDSNGRVIRGDSSEFSITDRRPFGVEDPAKLAADGYVIGDMNSGWKIFGPDETVLRSEQFAATHCFRLVRDETRPGLIGVSFEPVPQRRLADISGVIWVDQATSELREIEFQFVNAGELSRFYAGGYTRFSRVPSGAWIVNEWRLSAPMLAMRAGNYSSVTAVGRRDTGGGVLHPDR